MTRIQIAGNVPLSGEISVQGSKNAVLPILAASVLHRGKTILHHCPRIRDVEYMTEIMRELGCQVYWQEHTLQIDASQLVSSSIREELASKLRASVILMGSLLGRCGCARIPYPGGCSIGQRPIDLHLYAMRCLGYKIFETDHMVRICKDAGSRCCGADIAFSFPSVGATENAILAAVLKNGVTRISGCAQEPEIAELCSFLNQKGACICGMGTKQLIIYGVSALKDSEYCLMSDRIVAGSYLCAAAGTGGKIKLRGVIPEQLLALTEVLQQMGAQVEWGRHWIALDASRKKLQATTAATAPYPGFPTDLQSQIMTVMTKAAGVSLVQENLFESRFQTVAELQKMGAKIKIQDRMAYITGVPLLVGTKVTAHDLRGGAALVIAGLMADGNTVVKESQYIDRGYEDICGDLQRLGALISREPEEGVDYATAKEKKEESAEDISTCICGSAGIRSGHSVRTVSCS